MLKKNIKYTDFDGVERSEDFFFNLTKSEVIEMELSTEGGLKAKFADMFKNNKQDEIIKFFKELILKAYGEKGNDGKTFIKVDNNGIRLANHFSQSAAFDELFTECLTDDTKASEFINGLIPAGSQATEAEIAELKKELGITDDILPLAGQNVTVGPVPETTDN